MEVSFERCLVKRWTVGRKLKGDEEGWAEFESSGWKREDRSFVIRLSETTRVRRVGARGAREVTRGSWKKTREVRYVLTLEKMEKEGENQDELTKTSA